MGFGNLGFGEMLMILVIILVLFGAKRVPEIGASIGKGIREFKRNINDVDRHIREPEPPLRAADHIAGSDVFPASRQQEEEARPEPKRLM